MNILNKRIIAGITAFSWMILLYWIGGGDFTRGFFLAYWMFFTTVVIVLASTFPFNDNDK